MSSSHCANGNESGDKPNGEERSPKQQKTIDGVADQGDSNVESSSDSAEEARAVNVSAMKCVAVLPGIIICKYFLALFCVKVLVSRP